MIRNSVDSGTDTRPRTDGDDWRVKDPMAFRSPKLLRACVASATRRLLRPARDAHRLGTGKKEM
jgi:hypothetical protein